ncbi:MAG: TauD/TfdA family dioxygenase [Pseudonocardiaceae bacterium]
MISQLDHSEILDLTAGEAARIRTAAGRFAEKPGDCAADLAERAAALVTAFPTELVRVLHRYGNAGSAHNMLLVSGLLPDVVDLPPTPGTTTPPALGEIGEIGALTLLAVLGQLGEPFTFASLYEGRLVQHVTPVPGREDAQTSEGSEALAWHVEDAFTDDRCDFFGLLCLRGDPGAATLVSPARSLRLPGEVERVLRAPRFVVEPDVAHGTGHTPDLPVTAVLSGPPDDPEICFDAVYQRPADPADDDATAALAVLAVAVDAAALAHVLEPGQLLVADNRRVVHGRTVFRPRYDGTDRWLLRTMVCASTRAHRRRGASRALR